MILVVCPMRIEQEALAKAGYPEAKIGGHGKVQFAIHVMDYAMKSNPDLIVCAGACGGLSKELNIGDVIISQYTTEYDYKVGFWKDVQPMFPGDPDRIMDLRFKKFDGFNIHFGLMASGDEDIIDKSRANQFRGFLGVAWEGAGGARAAQYLRRPYLEIRTVTDMCGATAAQDFEKNIELGMSNIAQVLKTIL